MRDLVLEYVKETKPVNLDLVWDVSKSIFTTITKAGLFVLVAFTVIKEIKTSNQQMFVPIGIESKESIDSKRLNEALVLLNCPKEKLTIIKDSIMLGAKAADVDPVLIAVLMSTESEFVVTAKSKMGYKGLMQTPSMTKRPAVDTVHGAVILKEKLVEAKGDYLLSLTRYKGSATIYKNGKMTVGAMQAKNVLDRYKKIVDTIKIV